ncbi:MAG: hypothetical protein FWC95_06500 [Defluviitaleaceae bacterium]|nr:hypothetical protein [Defluviitaleaceae bacterium]
MAILLSLQGGMAVGKTTAARLVQKILPHVYVDFEEPVPIWQEVVRLGLLENTAENFVTRQRMFIEYEIKRREEAIKRGGVTLFDLGAEEIEFYSLYYPKSIGLDIDPEVMLAEDLAKLRLIRPSGVLYLDAGHGVLSRRRKDDTEKNRGFFDHYIEKMADDKRVFFLGYPNCTFLDVAEADIGAVADKVAEWVKTWI